MEISSDTKWAKLSLLCALLAFICFSLAACESAPVEVSSAEPVTFPAPALLRNIPGNTLSVTVGIDDQPTLYQGTRRDDGSWFVNIEVERNREHTATVSWYAFNNGQNILIARQTSTFFAGESGMSTLGGSLQTDGATEFDINCDGVSNYDELMQGTDPSSNNACGTPEPTPDDIPIPETIAVDPNCFDMGSPVTELEREEWETLHNICINERLYVGVYEVTFDQYFYFANQPENPEPLPFDDGLGSGNRPANNILWEEATSYAAWLSKVTGDNYRLLTEAEWEYVARAGTTTAFWTGDTIGRTFANINSDRLIEVGSLNQPNPWGFHDMHGNVAEWTCTSFQANYDGIAENTCDPSALVNKVLRGGPFYFGASAARSAARSDVSPSTRDGGIGFRVVRTE